MKHIRIEYGDAIELENIVIKYFLCQLRKKADLLT